jgi:hypothetical protein
MGLAKIRANHSYNNTGDKHLQQARQVFTP